MPWIIPLASAAYGAIQAGSAAHKKNVAENDLENQVKSAKPNQSILDYYGKALAKYNPNPYQTVSYQQQKNSIDRNLATGLNSAQNRRMGIGSVGAFVQQANDSSARAAGNAEASNSRDLSVLGQAAGAKSAEDRRLFDMRYNLTAMKAGANAATENTGIQNVFSGLGNAAYLYGMKDNTGGSGGGWDNGYNAGSVAYKMPRSRVTF